MSTRFAAATLTTPPFGLNVTFKPSSGMNVTLMPNGGRLDSA